MQMLKRMPDILTPEYSMLAENYSFKSHTNPTSSEHEGALISLWLQTGMQFSGKLTTPWRSDRDFQQLLSTPSTPDNMLGPVKAGYCYCIKEESLS